MAGFTIDYGGLPKEQAAAKALNDAIEYLGGKRSILYQRLKRNLRELYFSDSPSQYKVALSYFGMGMVGLRSGPPPRELLRAFWAEFRESR